MLVIESENVADVASLLDMSSLEKSSFNSTLLDQARKHLLEEFFELLLCKLGDAIPQVKLEDLVLWAAVGHYDGIRWLVERFLRKWDIKQSLYHAKALSQLTV